MPTSIQFAILIVCAISFALAISYFIIVKKIWRWNKFAAAIVMLIVFGMILVDGEFAMQYHEMIILLLCIMIASWLITAWAKYFDDKEENGRVKLRVLQDVKKELGIGE